MCNCIIIPINVQRFCFSIVKQRLFQTKVHVWGVAHLWKKYKTCKTSHMASECRSRRYRAHVWSLEFTRCRIKWMIIIDQLIFLRRCIILKKKTRLCTFMVKMLTFIGEGVAYLWKNNICRTKALLDYGKKKALHIYGNYCTLRSAQQCTHWQHRFLRQFFVQQKLYMTADTWADDGSDDVDG